MTNSIAQKFNVFTLLKFAFPTMVMMVFMSLYTIVDGIFVSRLVGSNALSAVNIVYPVISLLIACGIMLSTAVVTFLFNITMMKLGGEDGVAAITIVLYGQFLFTALYLGFSMGVAPVFSFNHGNQDHAQLKKIYKICKWFILLSSIVILGIALVFSEPIVGIFTGEENHTYELAVEGFFLFSFNYLFAGINIFASALFTALSNGKISAIISFCRTFVFIVASIVLLPMIMGITGVWLAVPLAELITLFISAWYLKGQKKVYHYG